MTSRINFPASGDPTPTNSLNDASGLINIEPAQNSCSARDTNGADINFETDKYPFCIVWTPIPLITCFFPFIGHMGIAMSNGKIRDFAGSYWVSEDNFGFGRPKRYLVLNVKNVRNQSAYQWDESVLKASNEYGKRVHNLILDNCHNHVAMALNNMEYNGHNKWGVVHLAGWMFFRGKYVGRTGVLCTWAPFLVIVILCLFSIWMWAL